MGRQIKICLDAGHYGKYNKSPANGAYYESLAMWKLHLMLKKYLESYGIEVITTRNNQKADLKLYNRGAKSKGCDLFISLHSNATGTGVSEAVDYPVAYAAINGKADKIATLLAECVEKVMDTNQKARINKRKGSSGADYYGVVRGATAVGTPGLILEHSFHSNTRSTNWLLFDSNLDKLAKAEADCIAAYYGLKAANAPSGGSSSTSEETAVDLLNGFVTVIYKGTDGLNIRTRPKIAESNVSECVHGGAFEVVGITEDRKWYKLKDGRYITAVDKYVKFTAQKPESAYTLEDFIREVQAATGSKVDGKAGSETLGNTPTISATKNRKHPVVSAIQKRFNALGFDCGGADGIAGAKFTEATKAFQKAHGCVQDGEITAKNKTWKCLLGMM